MELAICSFASSSAGNSFLIQSQSTRILADIGISAKKTEESLAALSQTEVWTFVGSADTIVEPENSLEFAQQLETVNGNVAVTVLDGADHFAVPGLAYLSKGYDLVQWLIQ